MVGKTISYYGILEKLGEGGNKTVTFRIIAEWLGSSALTNVRIALGDLTGPGGRKTSAGHLGLHVE